MLSLVNLPGSLVRGTGTLDVGAQVFTNRGKVAPGLSPGTLTIAGNFAQQADGHLEIEIDPAHAGGPNDLLKITGNAALGGFLDLVGPPGVAVGDTFQVITYGSRTGDFAVKTAPPGVSFDAIPGPTSYEVVRTAGGGDTVLPPFNPPPELVRDQRRDDPNKDAHNPDDPRDDLRQQQRRRVIPECR